MPRTRTTEESRATAGLGLLPPYPDLASAPGRPGQFRDGPQVRDAGAFYDAGHHASGRLGPLFLTLTGRNRQQLDFRLHYMVENFLDFAVSKPGRPARLDPLGSEASWIIEALVAASLARVRDEDEGRKESHAEFLGAVRMAEDRWLAVRRDLHRGAVLPPAPRPAPPGDGPSTGHAGGRQAPPSYERVLGSGNPVDRGTPAGPAYCVATQHGLIAQQRGRETSYQQPGRREPSRKV